MRLPSLAAADANHLLAVTRCWRNSPVCVTPLRRNQLTFATLLVANLIYISLVMVTYHSGYYQQQVRSQCHHYNNNSSQDWATTESNNNPAAATDVPSANSSPLNDDSSSNSVNINRPFLNYLVSMLRNRPFPGAGNYSEYQLIQHPERFRILPDVQPLMGPDFGPVVNDVTSFGYPIDIEPCQNVSSNNSIGLFLAIISAPDYFEKRDVIRQTWLSQLVNQLSSSSSSSSSSQQNQNESSSSSSSAAVRLVGHGFVVGLSEDDDVQQRIEEESAQHGDILQVDMMDTYADLTRKVAATLNWVDSRCPSVDFLLKVDDDVYVNVHNLISVVTTLNASHQPSIFGTSADGLVRRDGKFAVEVDDWPWSNYPPYSMGAFLLISGGVVRPLLGAAQTTPYFPFEDTYIGLCADKAQIKNRFSPRALGGFVTNKPQPCYVHNSVSWLTQSAGIVSQSHSATEEFYKGVTRCKKMIEMPIDPLKMPRKFDFT